MLSRMLTVLGCLLIAPALTKGQANKSDEPAKPDSAKPADWVVTIATESSDLAIKLGMSEDALKELCQRLSADKDGKDPKALIRRFGSCDRLGTCAIVWGDIGDDKYAACTVGTKVKDDKGKDSLKWATTFSTTNSALALRMGMAEAEFQKALKKSPQGGIDDIRFLLGVPKSPVVLTVVTDDGKSVTVSSADAVAAPKK